MGNTDLERCIWQDRERFYRLAYAYVRNKEDALDIVSESIEKALKNQKNLRDRHALKTWFYAIVIHTASDCLRKRRRIVYTGDMPESGRQDRYEDTDLSLAVTRLPEPLRAIVILRFFEDMKLDEIARVLKLNPSTVKSRLYRALRLLKTELSEEPGQTPVPGGR